MASTSPAWPSGTRAGHGDTKAPVGLCDQRGPRKVVRGPEPGAPAPPEGTDVKRYGDSPPPPHGCQADPVEVQRAPCADCGRVRAFATAASRRPRPRGPLVPGCAIQPDLQDGRIRPNALTRSGPAFREGSCRPTSRLSTRP